MNNIAPHPDGADAPTPLNVEQVAALLNRSTAAVRRLFLLRQLPGRKVGRRWMTTSAAMEAWLGGRGHE